MLFWGSFLKRALAVSSYPPVTHNAADWRGSKYMKSNKYAFIYAYTGIYSIQEDRNTQATEATDVPLECIHLLLESSCSPSLPRDRTALLFHQLLHKGLLRFSRQSHDLRGSKPPAGFGNIDWECQTYPGWNLFQSYDCSWWNLKRLCSWLTIFVVWNMLKLQIGTWENRSIFSRISWQADLSLLVPSNLECH